MKQLIAYIFTSLLISYLAVTPVLAQNTTEHVAASSKKQVTVQYKDGLLNMNCSAVPLGKVLQAIGDNTATKFVLTDPAIEKTLVTLSLQQVSIDNALKRVLRGYSYSSSLENEIETVTVFPSKTGKKNSRQPVVTAQTSTKKDVYIRPDTYIAPDTTIEVDEIRPDDYVDPEAATEVDEGVTPEEESIMAESDEGDVEATEGIASEADAETVEPEDELVNNGIGDEQEDELMSLDDYMPIDLPPLKPAAYNEEDGEVGNISEQYNRRVAVEQEMRLKRSLEVLASDHSNLYNDALNEIVGIDSPQVTTALLQAATTEDNKTAKATNIIAAEGLWHHAADLGFSDPASVAALQQMAQAEDPAVRKIGRQALRDMERYRARQ